MLFCGNAPKGVKYVFVRGNRADLELKKDRKRSAFFRKFLKIATKFLTGERHMIIMIIELSVIELS